MNNIQKKSLQQVSTLLNSVDTYPVYQAISKLLDQTSLESTEKNNILDKLQSKMNEMRKPVKQGKEWIETLISDL